MNTRTFRMARPWGTYEFALHPIRPATGSAVERRQAEVALNQFLFDIQGGDPEATRMAQELLRQMSFLPAGSFARQNHGELRKHLERALRSGQLSVSIENLSPLSSFGIQIEQLAQPAPTRAADTVLTFFELLVVDEVGEGVSGLDVVFSAQGTSKKVTTDGSGKAKLEEVPFSFASVRVASAQQARDAVKSRWDAPREKPLLEGGEDVVLAPLTESLPSLQLRSEKGRTLSLRPPVSQARLLGGFFETDKAFLLPSGVDGIRGLVTMVRQNPRVKLLIVGHTDTAGKPSHNDPLSLDRAKAVSEFLKGDVDAWYARYDSSKPAAQRWNKKEDLEMIEALPDSEARDVAEGPIVWFQRTRGLKQDGIAGEKTRKALIKEYMDFDGTSVDKSVEIVAHGCGENFPAADLGDGVSSAENRRIDVFLFDSILGVQPPPPGENSAQGAKEYPEWVRRSGAPRDFTTEDAAVRLELEWPRDVVESLPEDLALILSGEGMESNKQFLAMGQKNGDSIRIVFEGLRSELSLTLKAKAGDQELTLFSEQLMSQMDEGIEWEHELEELFQEEELSEVELVAIGGTPDDLFADREFSGEVLV